MIFILSATAGLGQTSLSASGLGGLKLPVKFGSKSTVANDAKPANLPVSYHEMLQSASASIQHTGGNGLQPVQKNHYVTGFAFFADKN